METNVAELMDVLDGEDGSEIHFCEVGVVYVSPDRWTKIMMSANMSRVYHTD